MCSRLRLLACTFHLLSFFLSINVHFSQALVSGNYYSIVVARGDTKGWCTLSFYWERDKRLVYPKLLLGESTNIEDMYHTR